MQDFQELADEAFRDLLEKHGRPTDLKTALHVCFMEPKHCSEFISDPLLFESREACCRQRLL